MDFQAELEALLERAKALGWTRTVLVEELKDAVGRLVQEDQAE